MGACYSVVADIRFKGNDEKSFCDAVKAKIHELKSDACFDLTRGDLNDPFGCFQVMTRNNFIGSNGNWYADFDASYGWLRVMYEVFSEAFKVLDEDSYIIISPDSDDVTIMVKDGKVVSNW